MSGGEWIGATSLPVVPAKSLFRERREPSRSNDAHLTPSQTHGVLTQADYMERTGNRVVLNLTGADSMRHVEGGDFISHLRSFQGGLEHSSLEGKVSAAYTVLAPRRRIDPRYYRYLFKSSRYIQGLKTTTDQLRDGQSIRYAQFALLSLPEPSLSWQGQVADYLDRETAQIEAFIADQEELISLLEERKGSLIATATTGSSAQSEWTSTRASRFVSVTLGKMLDQGHDQEATAVARPYIRAGNIGNKSLDATDLNVMAFTKAEAARLDIREGDLLVVEGGSVGLNYYCEVNLPGISFQKTVNRVRSRGATSTAFFGFVLDAMRFTGALEPHVNRSTISHLTAEKLERIIVNWPPLKEQLEIVAWLDGELISISAAIADARKAIELSKERRAALISAAVTGQIDVTEKKRVLV